MVKVNKISSNIVGLAIAEEQTYGVLPDAPVWYKMEPNTYGDTGATIATTAPNPISDTRQRRKGVVTDLDATAGFNHDLNAENMKELFQGFLFADTVPAMGVGSTSANKVNYLATGVSFPVSDLINYADTTGSFSEIAISGTKTLPTFAIGDYIVLSGLTGKSEFNRAYYISSISDIGNRIIGVSNTALTDVAGTLPEFPTVGDGELTGLSGVSIKVATRETSLPINENAFIAPSAGVISMDVTGGVASLKSNGGIVDFTEFKLKAGDWIFVGGDDFNGIKTCFKNSANNGFKRVAAMIDDKGVATANVTATNIVFDKTNNPLVAEDTAASGTDATNRCIKLYFGDTLSNSTTGRGITRRTYTIERTLGQLEDTSDPSDETKQCEIITGSVPNEMSINFPANGLMNVDVGFVAKDQELMGGMADFMQNTTGTITGEHLNQPIFNTVSDVSRMRLTSLDALGEALFGFVTEASITINNNVTPDKALGTLGAFDVTTGNFTVGGTVQAYFSDINAIKAIRENADVTIDYILVTNNKGIVFDLPLITLGDGRLNVEEGQSISLPLNTEAARSSFGYTMKIVFFPYLPNLADEM